MRGTISIKVNLKKGSKLGLWMELWIIEWPVGKEEQKKNEADPWEIEKTNSPQAQLTEADPSKWGR
ncbi:hypothetical protein ACOJBM_06495 [Rhizobium beringeri]